MSRVKATPAEYYALQGGVGYKAFLDHFKHQAAGLHQHGIALTPGANMRYQRARNRGSRLRLVKVANESGSKDPPKVEVVDPNESVKNRALSDLKREISDKTETGANIPQSTAARRRRNNVNNAASKAVKRARDVFDK